MLNLPEIIHFINNTMNLKPNVSKFTFGLIAIVTFSSCAMAQRHSGMVVNLGVKKNSFSLKEMDGTKIKDFKGSFAPALGLSYSHVLASKFNASYEFDISQVKGSYEEKFNPLYSIPFDPNDANNTSAVSQYDVKALTFSLKLLGHYQITREVFVSAGATFDRFLSPTSTTDEFGNLYPNDLAQDVKSDYFNMGGIIGLGYSTEAFRIDLRHSIGLINLIGDPRRYETLKLNQTSLTFGYYLGKR